MTDPKTVTTKPELSEYGEKFMREYIECRKSSGRIRTVYFWTQEQINQCKAEAEKLYNYFRGVPDDNTND